MKERTLLLIKPNALQQKNVGNIINLIEQNGFKIVALEMMDFDEDFAETFYSTHQGKPFFEKLIDFMTEDKCIAAILERDDAVEALRILAGNTDPKEAAEGTIRRLYGQDVRKNAVHASDSLENARREIDLIFPEEE